MAGAWVWGTRNKQTPGFFWQLLSFVSLGFVRLQQKPVTGSWLAVRATAPLVLR